MKSDHWMRNQTAQNNSANVATVSFRGAPAECRGKLSSPPGRGGPALQVEALSWALKSRTSGNTRFYSCSKCGEDDPWPWGRPGTHQTARGSSACNASLLREPCSRAAGCWGRLSPWRPWCWRPWTTPVPRPPCPWPTRQLRVLVWVSAPELPNALSLKKYHMASVLRLSGISVWQLVSSRTSRSSRNGSWVSPCSPTAMACIFFHDQESTRGCSMPRRPHPLRARWQATISHPPCCSDAWSRTCPLRRPWFQDLQRQHSRLQRATE